MTKVLVTMPVFNEAKMIRQDLIELHSLCSKTLPDFELLIVDDGSTDETPTILESMVKKLEHTSIMRQKINGGRGRALRSAWQAKDADIYMYIDADLAPDINQIPNFVKHMENGCDLVIASRYLPGSNVERPFLRDIAARYYNQLIRIIFKSKVYDHQCGLKAFSAPLIENILSKCNSPDWFWDTEMIVFAQLQGYKIGEIPIYWVEPRSKYTPIKRLIKDTMLHSVGAMKLIRKIYLAKA